MSKKLLFLISLVLVLSLSGSVSAVDPNLLAHYTFDWTYSNSGVGTVVAEPRYDAEIVEDADRGSPVIKLDGDADFVYVGNEDINTADMNSITLAAWVKSPEPWHRYYVSKGYDWTLFSEKGKIAFKGIGLVQVVGSYIATDTWHHLAATYDGTTSRVYVDGALDGEQANTGALQANPGPKFAIGAFYRTSPTELKFEVQGRIDDARFYNRVLSQGEIRALVHGTDVVKKAWGPQPIDNGRDVQVDTILSWQAGDYTQSTTGHDVYLSTSWADVNSATDANNPPGVAARQTDPNYDPPDPPSAIALEAFKTYYWRVDEYNDACSPGKWKGDIWSFETAEYIVIDDMEGYADETAMRAEWSDNSPAGTVFFETTAIHTRDQSMRFQYNTKFVTATTERTIDPNFSDWTVENIKSLTVWLRGFPGDCIAGGGNTIDPNTTKFLWVKLTHGDTPSVSREVIWERDNPSSWEASKGAGWTRWRIDLADPCLADVNMTNIYKMMIGVGDANTISKEAGTLYFDDIRLHRIECRNPISVGDENDDCVVDLEDVNMLMDEWLKTGVFVE